MIATSIAFGAALAHALELPHKISLSRDEYFVVQQIYAGWNRLGYVLLAQIAGLLAVVVLHRHTRAVWLPAAIALAAVFAVQALFWLFTFPANQATANWTIKPDNWDQLRAQWEYSHLAGAALQFAAMTAISIAALNRSPT